MAADTMTRARGDARALGDVPHQLAALEKMTVGQLAAKYRELYGEPTRMRNKRYLQKRLAWRIQELADGGLTSKALARITELGSEVPERWRMRLAAQERAQASAKEALPIHSADPRLPPAGTLLRRVYHGVAHEVTVCHQGFEYAGQRFKTLSAVAKRITGTAWNGFAFFGCARRGSIRDGGENS